ncbi:glycoside hydrolase family 3 N-terminal domain-containing protein [Cellulomonas chengniuliangii]|uniref:Glycoside hydrolase family 3 C-terminal domain-containing protein n=1 Tax=Cellulomonas chengniuliangii TaxID=2968084 RepID=A0ABY5L8Y8_9CELL|nr:glycoside hydrolase family 3 N-terminal domain-containing protein [Cellulomonas chengniuliangii]MCC2307860.1 glycoside hydrolase family 3 C-terminal domain-containing protein [Cellulomonas chengniuliangii]UUI77063.1 glycoside hydrolase family 3 C-terminal domain-containing protein [Cellulomonas chengniuliangii]
MPEVSERVAALHAQMTLEEKLAQIVGYWLDQGGKVVAPMQGEMAAGQKGSGEVAEVTRNGLGHFTRVYGTRPVEPTERAAWLWNEQRRLKRETRLGIPALVHEECLTGLAAWKAATFPTPLAWGAAFDPELVHEMGEAIGDSMRRLGIHQGLAPVLDVVRDPRWGRVEECIGEDPYLVGTVGTAYVRGLQAAGVHATLKHFVGYSASKSGRNHAPVSAGPREVADVLLPPFEMAIVDGGVKSVMNSYSDVDGVPMASSVEYLTDVLRGQLGFDGVVVADYFAVAFLEVMQAVAQDRGEAAALALEAGIDIELPTGDAYLEPLAERIRSGEFDEAYVDRAVLRALRQKEELGLLDADAFEDEPPTEIDLDSPRHQQIARRLAEESLVLVANDGVLPLNRWDAAPRRIAVVGPNAHRVEALQGCYSFANHVLGQYPDHEIGFAIPTVLEGFGDAFERAGLPAPEIAFAEGCTVEGTDTSGFQEAVDAANAADVTVVVVGDQAGLFGRGTVGEGNDCESLDLPGAQRELVEALVATGKPVVMVLITGRPYAIGWALDGADRRPAAVLQAFFPGEGGGLAIADVVTGAVNPSGRMPVSMPRSTGAQPFSYLHPILGGPSDVTATDSTPLRPFGFGLSYTSFRYSDLTVDGEVASDGTFAAAVTVTNTGAVAGSETVQLYGHDVVASVARPVVQLLGYTRVPLEPGASARVTFTVPATRFAFTGRKMDKIVEPGDVEVWVGSHATASSADVAVDESTGGAIVSEKRAEKREIPGTATPRSIVRVTGGVHRVTTADPRLVQVEVSAL